MSNPWSRALLPGAVTVVLLSLPAPSTVNAKAPSKINVEDVIRVLKARVDPGPADLATAGSGVVNTLVDLVVRTRLDEELRIRAARALGHYPCDQSRAVLLTTISNPEEPRPVRVAAMMGLARAQGRHGLGDLEDYLKNEAPALRTGAAQAIAAMGGDRARTLLMSAMHHEKVIEVRIAMDEALRKMK